MNNCNRQVDNKSIFDYPVNECKIATTSHYYTTQKTYSFFLGEYFLHYVHTFLKLSLGRGEGSLNVLGR